MLSVAILVFDGVDILDFAGPLEICSHASHSLDYRKPDPVFEIDIVGAHELIKSSAGVHISPRTSIETAISRLDTLDVLIVPGGPPPILESLIKSNSQELQLVQAFGRLETKERPRIILSICTGAMFLAASGLLKDTKATTHHLFLDDLRAICGTKGETNIVAARYVDGGVRPNGLRVITSGGVSSGLDAACYFVEQAASPQVAAYAAKMVEYEWKASS
ncbi:ThiJ/PfpI family protein [Talaromyces proteolyticus]|uniref:ThiJ/PfpI family protein n=1 Tax=Talaromyces proteolyticus TaxID=1131652 RepID=A0AAD4L046_9EURO|nr:ThiJ/PfpI family protein [Talaromyces proteolyticus]KAH8704227.1 ThiJ/PfpI family protein [Talaromyces proteolyticus]